MIYLIIQVGWLIVIGLILGLTVTAVWMKKAKEQEGFNDVTHESRNKRNEKTEQFFIDGINQYRLKKLIPSFVWLSDEDPHIDRQDLDDLGHFTLFKQDPIPLSEIYSDYHDSFVFVCGTEDWDEKKVLHKLKSLEKYRKVMLSEGNCVAKLHYIDRALDNGFFHVLVLLVLKD